MQKSFNHSLFPEISQGNSLISKNATLKNIVEFQQIYSDDSKHSLPFASFDVLMQRRISDQDLLLAHILVDCLQFSDVPIPMSLTSALFVVT